MIGNWNSGTVGGDMRYSAGSEGIQDHRKSNPEAGTLDENRDIFISHAHADAGWAAAIVSLLTSGLDNISKSRIHCSSLPGFGFSAGANIDTSVANNLRKSGVLICLTSPAGRRSSYVPMEVGAAWGLGVPVVQLVSGGEPFAGPLASTIYLDGLASHSYGQLLDMIHSSLGLDLVPFSAISGSVQGAVEVCVQAAREVGS